MGVKSEQSQGPNPWNTFGIGRLTLDYQKALSVALDARHTILQSRMLRLGRTSTESERTTTLSKSAFELLGSSDPCW